MRRRRQDAVVRFLQRLRNLDRTGRPPRSAELRGSCPPPAGPWSRWALAAPTLYVCTRPTCAAWRHVSGAAARLRPRRLRLDRPDRASGHVEGFVDDLHLNGLVGPELAVHVKEEPGIGRNVDAIGPEVIDQRVVKPGSSE